MPTSFPPSPSSVAPDRGITPVHSPLGVPAEPTTEVERGGGKCEEGGKEGNSWEEKRRGSLPPPAAAAPHRETCHSAGDGSFSVHA